MDQTSLPHEMNLSTKCFPYMSKMQTLAYNRANRTLLSWSLYIIYLMHVTRKFSCMILVLWKRAGINRYSNAKAIDGIIVKQWLTLNQKTYKLFCFQIFWFLAYMMKDIPEMSTISTGIIIFELCIYFSRLWNDVLSITSPCRYIV